MKVVLTSLSLVAWLALAGCQTTDSISKQEKIQPVPIFDAWQLANMETREVTGVDQLFALSAEQLEAFKSYYFAPENADIEQHVRLYNYLDDLLYAFDYRGDTLIANTALQNKAGNCMSLAIVTSALAEIANLEVRYQRVNSAPIYRRFDNVMTLSSHVRSHIYAPIPELAPDEIVLIRPKLVIDYFRETTNASGNFIDEADFLSMYYQNIAGDALIEEDYALAYANLKMAMVLDPKNPETLNTLGVLHRALGQDESAEKIYQYALDHTEGSLNLLSNYAVLLEHQGRLGALQNLEKRLANIEDDNPYRWFDIANQQFAKQNYRKALRYFKRSVKTAPYLHEGYFGMAKSYYRLGQWLDASDNIRKASDLAFTSDEANLYQAKLRELKSDK